MRFEKSVAVLNLARALAGSADGLTLEDIARIAGVSRRTAERMRDAVEATFGLLERIEEGRKIRFRIAARGLGSFAVAPTALELTELENAARALETGQDASRALTLRSLDRKIRASLREADRRRLDVDVESQVRAEAFARQVGPRPLADPAVLTALREALLAQTIIKFRYGDDRGDSSRRRTAVPYGILFAPRYYLVASVRRQPEPALFRLDRIHDVELTHEPGAPPADFDLTTYAARSFGVFQEEPEDIILRFSAAAAPDVRSYLFHPTQKMTDERDGSVTVSFRAGGLLQIAHHLMTWGSAVTILATERLKGLMRHEIEQLHAHHCPLDAKALEPERRAS